MRQTHAMDDFLKRVIAQREREQELEIVDRPPVVTPHVARARQARSNPKRPFQNATTTRDGKKRGSVERSEIKREFYRAADLLGLNAEEVLAGLMSAWLWHLPKRKKQKLAWREVKT